MSIVRAFTKLFKGENTDLAKERLRVCKDCDDRVGILCGICGCYLKAKTRDEEETCPLSKWEK